MKKNIIFITLCIIAMIVVLFVPYYIGKLFYHFTKQPGTIILADHVTWSLGFALTLSAVGIFFVIQLFYTNLENTKVYKFLIKLTGNQ